MTKLTNILLVEDNPAHIELIRRAFENEHPECQINTCNDLTSAQKTISSQIPQLIISDLNLPDGNGLKLIPEDKQRYPLILMTSYGDENTAVDAMKSGAADYIVKSPEAFSAMPKSVQLIYKEWENAAEKDRMQKELFYKEREQTEILNSMIDGVITTGEDGSILSFNKAAENIFGYSAQEASNLYLSDLISDDGYKNRATSIFSQDSHASKETIIEVIAKKKSQLLFPMRISISELSKGIDGRSRHINSCHDLSNEKSQEEQLRRSQKMEALGKLTGGIAHDYNNMLNIILGYSELLTHVLAEQPEPATYVNEIYRAGERGAQLTKKLLSFSKYKRSDSVSLNINNVLNEQSDMLSRTLTARVALKFDLEKDLWNTHVDNNDLVDTLLNLCINAMHAIDDQGQLTISTRNIRFNNMESALHELSPGNYVAVSILDSGCGMDEETKERIFDPFFTTKGENGTGLGLSQVYGFVERSHAAISVDSTLKEGTKFTLYFPQHVEDTQDTNQQRTRSKMQKNQYNGHETILIVDDEPALLNLSTKILEKSGYTVVKTGNPKQALKILDSKPIALLLSDVIMPEMDGYELANIVKRDHPNVKIQLASGYAESEDSNNDNNDLQRALLLKPYNAEQLLKTVRNLLDSDVDTSLQEKKQ